MRTKTAKTTKTAKKTPPKRKPPARCDIEFEPGCITSPAIEMEAFLWDGWVTEFLNKPIPEVCITLYEDSVSSVYVRSPADLEKMANWLLKAAEWMRSQKKG